MDTNTTTESRSEYSDATISSLMVPTKWVSPSTGLYGTPPGMPSPNWLTSTAYPGMGGQPLIAVPYWSTGLRLRTLYEERTKQDHSGWGDWNDFEHYSLRNKFKDSEELYLLNNIYGSWDAVIPIKSNVLLSDEQISGSISSIGSVDNPIAGLPALYSKQQGGRFIVEPSGLNTLINRAVRTMLGDIRPNLSSVNSVYELKDFARFNATVDRVESEVRRLKTLLPRVIGRFSFKGKRELLLLLATVADVYLQKQFNIDPLLKDLRAVQEVLQTVRQDILKRMADDARLRRRDFNSPLTEYQDVNTDVVVTKNEIAGGTKSSLIPSLLSGQCKWDVHRSVRYNRARFHAQILYTKYYSDYQKQNALVLGLLDKLGVNFNPAIMWNAIPWSFLVDWVVNVSSWLDQFKVSNMEPVTVIHKFLWSTQVERSINVVATRRPTKVGNTVLSNSPRNLVFCTESAYNRQSSRLNITAALSGSGVSPKEFTLAAALAASRYR